jgi:hypothetical protein
VACNIQNEFTNIRLGDHRREARLLRLAARLAESPGGSVREACQGWDETVAGYRLLHGGHADMQTLLESHRQGLVRRAIQSRGDLLLLQDTTELDYTTHKALRGSGPISDQSRRGFFLHNRLVVDGEAALVLGVASAHAWARRDDRHGVSERRKALPIQEKESMRWLEGYDDACRLAEELPGRKVIMVADRECDIYELYARWQESPGADFIVRARYDRRLLDERDLLETLRGAPLLGSFELEVERRVQRVKVKKSKLIRVRESRLAVMEVRAMPVRPRPPHRKGVKLPQVEFRAVLVAEKNPPGGQEPVQWLLFSTLPVGSYEEAMRIVDAYTHRWLAEEFHRVLKSGCRIEALALREGNALLAAIALYMVVAWRILYLRDLSRSGAQIPGTRFFTEAEARAACLILKSGTGNDPPTLGELTVMVAKMGGYAARKSDHPPGAQCLWRGLEKLRCYVEMGQALDAL